MSENQVDVKSPPERVFDVIADARTYPLWLVGAKRIRHVEEDWPAEGSSFHHTVGMGPLVLHDCTTVTRIERPSVLELEAGIGPLGAAHVVFTVEPTADGSRVVVDEAPSKGVVKALWRWAGKLVLQASLFSRNLVSLEQLCTYVEAGRPADPDRAAGHGADDPDAEAPLNPGAET
jgi:uncharacterized protein YndB with AHSA1/START domain